MIRAIVSFILFLSLSPLIASPLDSIGTEKKNGKVYIVHKVEPKETLYSLSRKYNVTVDEIKAANSGNAELKVGQTVLIPSNKPAASNSDTGSAGGIKHKVDAKETLYSISRKYDISLEELKKANPGVNELKVGQELTIPVKGKSGVTTTTEENKNIKIPDTYIVQPKETFYSISRKFGISVADLQKFNPEVKELQVGQSINLKENVVNYDATNIETTVEEQPTRVVVEKKPTQKTTDANKGYVQVKEPQLNTTPEKNMPTFSNLKKDGYMKINESGLVESYPDNSGFHYALHKTAPVGTIIYLVNEENGQKVYVRVIGKLTDASPAILMKVSPKAYEKLSQGSSKVKVNATYIP